MRTYDQIKAAARPGPAFSNGTGWEIWSAQWCDRCVHDSPELVDAGRGCPLIGFAMASQLIPAEWVDDETSGYTCAEFRERRDGDGDVPLWPPPDPQIPGQTDIFELWAEQITEQVGNRTDQLALFEAPT